MKKTCMFLVSLILGTALMGADLYVSQATGKKKGPGTKESPFKTIFDAVKKAAPGDTIYIAEGKYLGKMDVSEIIIDKAVTLRGGYSKDFATRDIAKHACLIQPENEKNDTKGLAVLTLNPPAGMGPDLVIDGLVIDQSLMNSYHPVEGKPAGLDTGMWLEPPAHPNSKFASAKCYSIYKETQNRFEGNIVIQNCVIVNSGNYGICLSHYSGSVKIVNNIFVACRMEACEVSCSKAKPGALTCEFANNTVLFTWSRTKEFEDMGYGFRCMANVTSNIHHNIFGFNIFAGVGNDKGTSASKKVSLDNNMFFLNKNADVTAVKSPSILKLRVDDEAFEDMADFPGMESVENNSSPKDPGLFKGRINSAYLSAFLAASYSEKTDYDENSPANTFRSALGLNKVGKITSKVSMYGNLYPLQDAYLLFGAIPSVGAQIVK